MKALCRIGVYIWDLSQVSMANARDPQEETTHDRAWLDCNSALTNNFLGVFIDPEKDYEPPQIESQDGNEVPHGDRTNNYTAARPEAVLKGDTKALAFENDVFHKFKTLCDKETGEVFIKETPLFVSYSKGTKMGLRLCACKKGRGDNSVGCTVKTVTNVSNAESLAVIADIWQTAWDVVEKKLKTESVTIKVDGVERTLHFAHILGNKGEQVWRAVRSAVSVKQTSGGPNHQEGSESDKKPDKREKVVLRGFLRLAILNDPHLRSASEDGRLSVEFGKQINMAGNDQYVDTKVGISRSKLDMRIDVREEKGGSVKFVIDMEHDQDGHRDQYYQREDQLTSTERRAWASRGMTLLKADELRHEKLALDTKHMHGEGATFITVRYNPDKGETGTGKCKNVKQNTETVQAAAVKRVAMYVLAKDGIVWADQEETYDDSDDDEMRNDGEEPVMDNAGNADDPCDGSDGSTANETCSCDGCKETAYRLKALCDFTRSLLHLALEGSLCCMTNTYHLFYPELKGYNGVHPHWPKRISDEEKFVAMCLRAYEYVAARKRDRVEEDLRELYKRRLKGDDLIMAPGSSYWR